MQTIRITTSQNIEIDYDVASLSDRIAARIVDYVVFLGIYTVCIFVFMAFYGIDSTGTTRGDGAIDKGVIVVFVAVWLGCCVFYDLLTEVFFNGQSFGKRSLKIKVISLKGNRPRLSQYMIRWIFRIVDFGITLGTAAVVSVAFSDNKQRIGDMIAGTTLVKTIPRSGFNELVFSSPSADYQPIYKEVINLTDKDVTLIYDVIKNFNRTRNCSLVYRLAMRIKAYLGLNYSNEINEYQFLEIILNDYNFITARGDA
jgi:uncharacterized RDD family membrane protein YckC